MNKYINTTFEISLGSLIRFVLQKWWGILIAGFICGAICVGIKYYTFVPETIEPLQQDYLPYDLMYDSYTDGQINIVNEIYQLYEKAGEADEYTHNSIYYNLNPFSVSCSSASFRLTGISTDRNDINALINAYYYAITDGEYLSELSENMSIPEEYLRELVIVGYNYSSVSPTSDYALSSYIQISVYGDNYEQTEYILDNVLNEMPIITSRISESIEHECEFVSREYAQESDETIMNAHSRIDLYITDLYAKINNLTNYQKNIAEPTNQNRTPVTTISKTTLLKYALVGLFAGVVLYIGILVLLYIFNNKVTDVVRFRNRYNIKDLGKSDAMIVANIMNYRCSDGKILLTGMATEQKVKEKIKSISADLNGIQILEALDILNNAESRMRLLDCNDVVLVEERSKSKYSDIDEELNVLFNMNKNVIGVILI